MGNNKRELSDKINQYVSNLDKDIYTVGNIPEEVVAVIFAWGRNGPVNSMRSGF